MEQINLSDLIAKHNAGDFKLQQVCQLMTKDRTIYEFLYDNASNKALLDIVQCAVGPVPKKTTYQFENKDITLYEAFELCGLKNSTLELDSVFCDEPAIWSAPVYLGSPVNSVPLATGGVSFVA